MFVGLPPLAACSARAWLLAALAVPAVLLANAAHKRLGHGPQLLLS